MTRTVTVIGAVLLIAGPIFYFFSPRLPPDFLKPPTTPKPKETQPTAKTVEIFTFKTTIPAAWDIEKIETIDAVNIYHPGLSGSSALEKSQIFVRNFSANTFLTLPTVNILERKEHKVGQRDAVTYLIEKKSGVPNFPHQPSWRNQKHRVTDVKGDNNFFYVFAKRPDLPDSVFEEFLESLSFAKSTEVSPPLPNFTKAVTKKGFGVFVTPENSPIKPERFRGYHTGADAEVSPAQEDSEAAVFAISNGQVVLSQTASGYGGAVVIKHLLDNRQLFAIYGHLDPKSLVPQGKTVAKGERIGILGKGNSKETDFERKHLHFGIYTGPKVDLRGYIENKEDLSSWLDPIEFFQNKTFE